MSARITGRVEILVNGQPVLNKTGASASGIGLSGKANFERTPVSGPTGLHGYMEEFVPATLEVTISDRDDVSLNDLANIDGNGTIIFRRAGGGKSYTMADAICNSNFTITDGEGETTVTFFGKYWTETVES